MDENEDEVIEDNALTAGEAIIVHTDDTYEVGVLAGAGDNGLRLRVTHRVERVYPDVTVGERTVLQQEILELNRFELIRAAMERGDKWAVTRRKTELAELALEDAVDMLRETKKPYDTLKPLTRSIATFIPWGAVDKIVSFEEWHEEQTLRPLALQLVDIEKVLEEVEAVDKAE